jgi:preprotein translocase subunit SecD
MKARNACFPLLAFLLLVSTSESAAQKSKLQDQGGIRLALSVRADGPQVDQIISRTIAVIERRCRLLGIYCRLQRPDEKANRVTLDFSTRMESERVKRILLAKGLELRAVISPSFPDPLLDYATLSQAMAAAGADNDVFSSPGEERYLATERVPFFTGDDLRRCVVLRSAESLGEYEVDCRLKPAGATRLESWTRANINRYVAVIFDRGVLSVAYIKAPIFYNVVVSGGFNKRQAQDALVILQSGNLHPGVELAEDGTSSPQKTLAFSRRYVNR